MNDVMNIKICQYKQIETNYVSNESTLQDKSNGVYNFIIWVSCAKLASF